MHILLWCISGGSEPRLLLGPVLWTETRIGAGDSCGAGRSAPPGEHNARLAHDARIRTDVHVPVRFNNQTFAQFTVPACPRPQWSGICRLLHRKLAVSMHFVCRFIATVHNNRPICTYQQFSHLHYERDLMFKLRFSSVVFIERETFEFAIFSERELTFTLVHVR